MAATFGRGHFSESPLAQGKALIIPRPRQSESSVMNAVLDVGKPIITVMPEYGGVSVWLSRNWDAFEKQPDANAPCPEIPDDLDAKLAEWQSEFESLGRDQEEATRFDWVEYHRRGIALCVFLKRALGDSAIVVYEKAYEDPCHHDAERREILPDGTYRILPSVSQMERRRAESK